MKRSLALVASLVLATLSGGCRPGSTSIPEARADEGAATSKGVAVVELFTSEGCSSCPPADDVLADLANATDRPVYALAFHVDYWDDLGWPDRFASHESTQRQSAYARAFGKGGLYTPQMIVGGVEAFTGSDRSRALTSVADELSRPAPVGLAIHPRWSGSAALAVAYEASAAPPGAVLNVALVERSVSSRVQAGENAGKTLQHANVVRAFVTQPLVLTGAVTLAWPTSMPRDGAQLVAYAQQPSAGHGMPVLGATQTPLPSP